MKELKLICFLFNGKEYNFLIGNKINKRMEEYSLFLYNKLKKDVLIIYDHPNLFSLSPVFDIDFKNLDIKALLRKTRTPEEISLPDVEKKFELEIKRDLRKLNFTSFSNIDLKKVSPFLIAYFPYFIRRIKVGEIKDNVLMRKILVALWVLKNFSNLRKMVLESFFLKRLSNEDKGERT